MYDLEVWNHSYINEHCHGSLTGWIRELCGKYKVDLSGYSKDFGLYKLFKIDAGEELDVDEYHTPRGAYLIYDPKFWRLIDLPDDLKKLEPNKLPKTLQYIGGVDKEGKVLDKISDDWFQAGMILYKTWAGLKGLRKNPGLHMSGLIRVFEGCQDFDAFEDIAKTYISSYYSGWSKGNLYAGLESEKILSDKDALESLYVKYDVNNVPELIPKLEDSVHYLPTGHRVIVKHITKASEISTPGIKLMDGLVIGSDYSPVRTFHQNISIYVYDEGFVNDTSDTRLFSITGCVLNTTESKPFRAYGDVVELLSDCTIIAKGGESACITPVSPKLTIKGNGHKLTLVGTYRQPCIGPDTYNNLSYGRWSINNRMPFDSLVLDNVEVLCDSEVSNFAIGIYGCTEIPEITLINGASIECPELLGRRLVRTGHEGIIGSTKSAENAEYAIV